MKIAWIDIETTGLDPKADYILELALIITDENLEILDQNNWVIRPSGEDVSRNFAAEGERPIRLFSAEKLRERMNDWLLKTHTESGLLADVEESMLRLSSVDEAAARLVNHHGGKYKPILAGSSPHFDRGFISEQMPALHAALHYRHFDTSTVERAFEWWRPDLRQPRDGRNVAHRAVADIRWSLECARYYKGVVKALKAPGGEP